MTTGTLQLVAPEEAASGLSLLEQAPFDVLLLGPSLRSETILSRVSTLRHQQPFLRLWYLLDEPETPPTSRRPDGVIRWPFSVTDLRLALLQSER